VEPTPLRTLVGSEWARRDGEPLADAILDAVSDAVIAIDSHYRVIWINRAAAALYHTTPEAALGRGLRELYAYEWDRPEDEAAAFRALEETGSWRGANTHVLPNGTRLRVESTVSVLRRSIAGAARDEDRTPGLLAVIRDCTAEHAARARAAEERDFFERLLDLMPVLVTRYDTRLSRVYFNRAFVATLGWTEADSRAHDIMELCYPDPAVRAAAAEFMARPGSGWREIPTRAKDGRTLQVLWANVLVAGDIQVGVGLDVSDNRRVQQSLRDSEERARVALDAAELGNFRHDYATGVVQLDERCARHFGFDHTQVSLADLVARVHPDDLPPLREAVRRAWLPDNDPHDYRAEYRVVHPDGTVHWLAVRGRVHFGGTGSARHRVLGVAVTQDVTARKDAELALRDYAERLREADRRKDVFIATLAHELRNPLAPIRNAVRVLASTAAGAREQQWSRDVIDRQVCTMARLLDDLLDAARITQGKVELRRESVLLAGVVETAVETSRPLIDARQHAFETALPEVPVRLDADPVRLCQVIANLLNNAAKYTPPGGRITLRATLEADEVHLVVTDSGIGLDRPSLARIFDVFEQVETNRLQSEGGLGIGLALVKGLVEQHGGRVAAESAGPGLGAAFHIWLPAAGHAPAVAEATADRAGGARRRVLVADDNRDNAEMLAMLLRLEGHEVAVEHSGAAALAAAIETEPEVAFLDIGMPGLDGYALAERLRAHPFAKRPVLVAVTGWGQAEDRRRALAAGYDHHLTKPADPALVSAILDAAGQ
jgi:PAS domain S-box-containing protein